MRILVKDLIPGSTYNLQFRSKSADEVSVWSPTFPITISTQVSKPQAPDGVSLTAVGDSFQAGWNRVLYSENGSPATDLVGYVVQFRNVVSNQIATFETTDTSFELTFNLNFAMFTPIAGQVGVKVAAKNNLGTQSDWSEEVITQNPPPGPVQNLTASGIIDAISAKWDAPANLEGDFKEYRAYIGTTAGFTPTQPFWTGVGTNAVFYTTSSATSYWVKVIAYDKFDGASTVATSGPVSPRSSVTVDLTAPATPTGLAATISGTKAVVSWNAVADPDADLAGYQIGYRRTGTTEWNYATTGYDATTVSIEPIVRYASYDFNVRAHDFSFNYSPASATVVRAGDVNTAPASSPTPTASAGVGAIFASWSPVANDETVIYEVHLGTATGFAVSAATKVGETPSTFTTIQKLPNGSALANGTDYFVRLVAKDSGGSAAAGGTSSAVSLTYVPTMVDVNAVNTRVDDAITGSVVQYAVNSSETVAPTTGWSETTPTRTPGTFVWYRTVLTYGDGSGATSNAALLTGNTGATGATGSAGADGADGAPAYTVLLTNESHDFPGGTSAAIAGSTTSDVLAYKGTAQQTATVGTITGQVTGLTTAITNNGTTAPRITVTVTTALVARNGILAIPVTVDGVTFTKNMSWSVNRTGATGAAGPSVSLAATTQVFTVDAAGAISPATSVVTGTVSGTTISTWTYSVNGGAFSATKPAYVSTPASNSVTVTASTMTDRTVAIKATGAITTATDTVTIAKVVDGATGSQGIPGPAGADGVTTYTWLKYADTPTTGMSDDPTGKTYMGIAVNKTTATESSTYSDYTWSLIKGEDGTQGIQGPPGADGQTTYTWVKYADSAVGAGMADSPTGKTYIGLAFNKTTAVESTTATDYQWSLIQGPQGIQGSAGTPGTTYYTWLKYANSATPAAGDMSDSPTGKTYMGLAVNKTSATESTVYTDYVWSLIQGPQGNQGIPGTPGADGVTTYTWIKYATDVNGAGISDDPTGRPYIGLAHNKTTATESTTPGDYTWSLIQGPQGSQGIQGPAGADGATLYTWLKYADTPTTGMSDTPTGKTYMGVAYNKPTATESTNYADYAWSLIKGADGSAGSDGKGISTTTVTYQVHTNGTTAPTGTWQATPQATTTGQFLWTKTYTVYTDATNSTAYSVAAHGSTGSTGTAGRGITGTTVEYQKHTNGTTAPTGTWTTAIPATSPGEYLWTRTTTTYSSAPTSVISYAVSKHGETGSQGIPGPAGADGVTTYTWIKYGDSAAGAGMSDDPTGKTYIGLAYNKTTATESSVAGDYAWSLIQGPQGPQGIQGSAGTPGTTYYTWLKYADTPTTGMSDSPTGKSYMGLAYNKTTSTESSNYADYTWSLIKGADGSDGKGISGTVVTYQTGTSGTVAPTGTWQAAPTATTTGQFLWTRTVTTYTDASNSTAYAVSAHGATGSTGSTGAAGRGITGTTVEYQASSSGTTTPTGTWLASIPATTPGQFLWTRTITTYSSAPTSVTAYSVAKHGETGSQGVPGTPGADGTTTYTWVKYADSAAGAGMADLPAGKAYIGLAFNKTTAVESSTPGDYSWSLIQGADGADGVGLTSVTPYYYQQASNLSAPAVPVASPPPAPWTTAEPAYVEGTAVWRTERIVYTNATFAYTPVSRSSAYDAAVQSSADLYDKVLSRGTDLVTNGTGYLGTNYNFPGFTFDASDAPSGSSGSFVGVEGSYTQPRTFETIPVDSSKMYVMSAAARQVGPTSAPPGKTLAYIFQVPYDAAGLEILPRYYLFKVGTTTTLTADLNPGDTTMSLADSTGWWGPPSLPQPAVHYRTAIFWDFVDQFGKAWPTETYSRNVTGSDFYADGAISASHVVTLKAPYVGPSHPAGTPVSNANTAGSYAYMVWTGQQPTREWINRKAIIGGVALPSSGNSLNGGTDTATGLPKYYFAPGTASLRIGFLSNYDVSPGGNNAFAAVSLSDAMAAQSIADGKATIHYQPSAPALTTADKGDIWIDSDANPKTYKTWDGSAWQDVTDALTVSTLAKVNTKINTYYAAGTTAPTGTGFPPAGGYVTGDLWVRQSDNRLHRYNGTAWVDLKDAAFDDVVQTFVVEYSVSSSETVAPTTGWSVTQPTRTPGTFVWHRTVITYGDGTTSTSNPALLTGNTGSQGIPGTAGADGASLYTWLKYADTPTTGMSDVPTGKTYMGIAYNKASATESSNYADYTWSLIKGADGSAGSDGKGISTTVVTYQTHSNGTTAPTGTWSSTPTATTTGQFLWTRTVITYTDASTATAYSVSAHGATGSTGAAGRGITGTVVEYQKHTNGTTAPTGTWTAAIPATSPGEYLWTRTVTSYSAAPTPITSYSVAVHGQTGSQGIQGPPGSDGQPTYTWIKYGTSAAGAGISDDPTGKTYIGIAYNKTTQTESTTPGDYTWSLIQGPQGSQGIPGTPGDDGITYYTWIKYADSPTTGMSDSPTGKAYMGIAYNKTTATESSVYSDYAWSLIQGAQGVQGIPGTPGADGTTTYTWVKYGTSAAGAGLNDSPVGMTYIGLAFNKTTAVESTVATDYTWSLIQGPQGNTGNTGAPGASVSLTATSQVLTVPATGGATNPTTSTVTGTGLNTTITAWTYSSDGAAFTATVPAGVSRTGNVVTITGSTMTARTITVRMADAAGVADSLTVAKVSDGATGSTGGTGAPGADGYTVLLTNESQVFAGSTTAALAGSATTTIVGYKGSTLMPATVGTITGQVTGMTTSIASNGTTAPVVTVTVTTALTTKNGTLTIPVTVDGKVFNKIFSWSLSLTGATGSTGGTGATGVGISSVTPYFYQTVKGMSPPAVPTTSPPPGTWVTVEPAYATNTELYRTERIVYTNSTFAYTPVSKVSSYDAAAGVEDRALSRGTDLVTNGTGYLKTNYNFSPFVVDLVDVPTGSVASFKATSSTYGSRVIDELIPIDPAKKYLLSWKAKQTVAGSTDRHYGLVSPYDATGLNIQPGNYMFMADTTTTLAVDLVNGATTIQLTDSANWWGSAAKPAGTNSHYRSYIIWNYLDANGKVWPPFTYSRLMRNAAWADGGLNSTTHTITLTTPYSGPTMPAGTPISNGSSGGSFIYTPSASNVVLPETWTRFAETMDKGIMPDATAATGRGGATWASGLPPGTAQIKVGWLLNADPSPANAIHGIQSVAAVSLSDAAAAQSTADSATTIAVTADKRVQTGTTVPTVSNGTGVPTGGLWHYYGPAVSPNTGTVWLGTYRWSGSAWTLMPTDRTSINAIDIGTGTFGDLAGDRLVAKSVTAAEMAAGTITATSGIIANAAITNAMIDTLEAQKITAGTGLVANLTVKSTLTMGDAATNGIIQSFGFSGTTAGFKIDKTGAIINQGSVEARTLKIQVGQNLIPAAYADFELADSFYTSGGATGSASAVIGVVQSGRFNNQSLSMRSNNAGSTEVHLGGSLTDYNIPVEGGKTYIVSAYVNGGTVSSNFQMRFKYSNGTYSGFVGATTIAAGAAWTRISGSIAAPAGVTGALLNLYSSTALVNAGWDVDGIQVEEKIGAISTPSAWAPPGVTRIDGGMIRTGEIRSTQTLLVNGVSQPFWSINTAGGMQIGSAVVRGSLTIGATSDAADSFIQSSNYVPGTSGFFLRGSDGYAEFRNLAADIIGTTQLKTGTLSASNIESGTIQTTVGIGTTGKIVAGDALGTAAELDSNALHFYALDTSLSTPARFPVPLVTLGSGAGGGNYLGITNGLVEDPVVSLDMNGGVNSESLSVATDPTFSGQLLMGAWMNRDVGGDGDKDSILWNMPWGMVGEPVNVGVLAGHLRPAASVEQLLVYGDWRLIAGRQYRVRWAPIRVRASGVGTNPQILTYLRTEYSAEGTPPVPTTSSTQSGYGRNPYSAISQFLSPLEVHIRPGSTVWQRFAVSIKGENCAPYIVEESPAAEMHQLLYVEDMGPRKEYDNGVVYGSASTPLRKFTYYFYPTLNQYQQGSVNSAMYWNGSNQAGKLVQGWNSTMGAGPYHSWMRFYNATSASGSSATGVSLASAVSGASRIEAKLRLTGAWASRASASAKIGWATSDTSSPSPSVASSLIAPGSQITTALGTTGSTYVKNNASTLRLTVGPGSGSSDVDLMGLYGYQASTSQRPRLQVDVWK